MAILVTIKHWGLILQNILFLLLGEMELEKRP